MPLVRAYRLLVQCGESTIVVVADLWKRAIRSGVREHEVEHALQAPTHISRYRHIVALAQPHAGVPELGDQTLVADALLEVHAVRMHLAHHLAPDDFEPLLAPGGRGLE